MFCAVGASHGAQQVRRAGIAVEGALKLGI